MKYNYHEMNDADFERLLLLIAQKLFGIGARKTGTGRDGGLDVIFEGTAELYPSTKAPWTGITGFQAKHTESPYASIGENVFFKADGKSSIITSEALKVSRLVCEGRLNNYIMFTNRRVPEGALNSIVDYLYLFTGIPKSSIKFWGVDQIEDFLRAYPEIARELRLNPFESRLFMTSENIAEVVDAFSRQDVTALSTSVKNQQASDIPVDRGKKLSLEQKNIYNNCTEEYSDFNRKELFTNELQFTQFFENPINASLKKKYEEFAFDCSNKIILYRKDYHTFDDILERIYDQLIISDPVLKNHKKTTHKLLFYMYWFCDIGRNEEHADTPNKTFAS